jgi:hypothetical protein
MPPPLLRQRFEARETNVESLSIVGYLALVLIALVISWLGWKWRSKVSGALRIIVALGFALAAAAAAFLASGTLLFEILDLSDSAGIPLLVGSTGLTFLVALGASLRAPPAAPVAAMAAAPASKTAAPVASVGPADVFISYKRDERAQVEAIARALEALKLNVWFDAELRSGTSFDQEIERHVRSARCMLVCWSPGAVSSEWVRAEATIGRQRDVLAAVMLRPCDLPPPFNLVHTEDLSRGPVGEDWLRVLERIGALTRRPGLAAFARANDAASLGRWIAAHGGDPLVDTAIARLKGAPA